jgi:phospholipid transport system substrate-binding protein
MSYFKDSIGIAIIFGLLLVFFNESVWAQPEPDVLISDAVGKMYEAALDPRSRIDPEEITAEVILPLLAVEKISKRVMSRYWRSMSSKQRAQFLKLFPKIIIKIHARMLNRIGEATIFFPQNREPRGDNTIVKMEIRFQRNTHKVGYVMQRIDGEWKVIDMNINGLSMVANYQTKIASTLRNIPRALLIGSCSKPRAPECIQAKMFYFLDGLDRKVNPRELPNS